MDKKIGDYGNTLKAVVNIVKKLKKEGVELGQIEKELLSKEWTHDQIKEILKLANIDDAHENISPKIIKTKHHKLHKIKYFGKIKLKKKVSAKHISLHKRLKIKGSKLKHKLHAAHISKKLSKLHKHKKLKKSKSKKFKLKHAIKAEKKELFKYIGGDIETDFDKLVDLVNKAGVVKLSTVAKLFKINIKRAEEWAKILDEHSLLKLHYPAFGKPELKKWNK